MKATWILPDGREITAEVTAGHSLMEAAVAANVPGIIGECGGTMSCATCHVHVTDDWRAKVGGPSDFEDAMLDIVEGPRTEASRLSCQIEMSDTLDGLVLKVPFE
ncbi:MAG: 2Fe-2S iron-sulfur cluster binding domain-containing protein [Rhodobacter sp.]|nr:2Fe-2S iron-sulfur cluster binding domain-containing protein [Paracoccaceae bacterium]MCB1409181.1 2Fe-2S iron-sulfur cluster binding domain-containing protein [Paracoccaceae bacterium]MCC0080772.1 2Fe-2S iron-sulfur cluster binding domain-containing protein [Rhodobacter sp.]